MIDNFRNASWLKTTGTHMLKVLSSQGIGGAGGQGREIGFWVGVEYGVSFFIISRVAI